MTSLGNQTILITGAGGFVGPSIVRALRARGAGLRIHSGAPNHAVSRQLEGEELLKLDITDFEAVRPIVSDCDTVVHLAGPASVAESFRDPATYVRVHVEGTANVIRASIDASVRRLVYISSAEIYGGPHRKPVTESAVPSPRSPYGIAKLAAEQIVRCLSRGEAIEVTILRPFSIYGPGVSSSSLIGTIVRQCIGSKEILLDNLAPIRDYCHVADLAEAVVAACRHPYSSGTFNVASGVGTSVLELAEVISGIMEVELPILEREEKGRPTASDIPQLVANTSAACAELDWRPRIRLEEGLRDTISSLQCDGADVAL